MALADLKKTCGSQFKPRVVGLDDFIEDANHYARGLPSSTSNSTSNGMSNSTVCHLQTVPGLALKRQGMKRATFTLTESVQQELAQLSAETGIAKSKLLRILVRHVTELDEKHQQALLTAYWSDD